MDDRIRADSVIPAIFELDMGDVAPSISIDDVFYIEDLKQRKIYLNGEVTENMTQELARHIIQFNIEDADIAPEQRTPIRLYIYSPGGDLHSALSLIDTIELSKTPVYGFNMGDASSAAFLILIACHKRYCLKNSTVVVHRGSGIFAGAAGQIDSSVGYYKKVLLKIRDYIIDKTKIDARTYKKRQDEDWYLDGTDQVAYEIAQIIEDMSTIIGVDV